MALGTLTVLSTVKGEGPLLSIRCSLVGDAAYPAGGTVGLLAAIRAKLSQPNFVIQAVQDTSIPTPLSRLEYDHTNDKLFARVKTTGVESAVSDQSAVTYNLTITGG